MRRVAAFASASMTARFCSTGNTTGTGSVSSPPPPSSTPDAPPTISTSPIESAKENVPGFVKNDIPEMAGKAAAAATSATISAINTGSAMAAEAYDKARPHIASAVEQGKEKASDAAEIIREKASEAAVVGTAKAKEAATAGTKKAKASASKLKKKASAKAKVTKKELSKAAGIKKKKAFEKFAAKLSNQPKFKSMSVAERTKTIAKRWKAKMSAK